MSENAEPGDITLLLQQADQGDRDAENRLFQLVKEDLIKIAKARTRRGARDLDCSTMMLIDDAYVRLVGKNATHWAAGDRTKFFGYMAKQMEFLIVQSHRRAKALKRGANALHLDIADKDLEQILPAGQDEPIPLLDLTAALDKFDQFAGDEALVFRLRYFMGFTYLEIARQLQISETTTKARFAHALAWLKGELRAYQS